MKKTFDKCIPTIYYVYKAIRLKEIAKVYKIKLASGYQTIEFEIPDLSLGRETCEEAIRFINEVGQKVIQPKVDNKADNNVVEMATENQIKYLKQFGIDASSCTKKEASERITAIKNAK